MSHVRSPPSLLYLSSFSALKELCHHIQFVYAVPLKRPIWVFVLLAARWISTKTPYWRGYGMENYHLSPIYRLIEINFISSFSAFNELCNHIHVHHCSANKMSDMGVCSISGTFHFNINALPKGLWNGTLSCLLFINRSYETSYHHFQHKNLFCCLAEF